MIPSRKGMLQDLRLAGQVLRYHTWPTIQRQTVADHTWNVLRIWFDVFGAPPVMVVAYIMFHDCGELKLGDLPYPVKKDNQGLAWLCAEIEAQGLGELGIALPTIDSDVKLRVKVCDLLEMYEFGCMEKQLGNVYAGPIVNDTEDHLLGILKGDGFNAVEANNVRNYIKEFNKRHGVVR